MRRLHVLLVPAYYPSADSPVNGLFMRDLARAISLVNDVTVLAPQTSGSDGPERDGNVRIVRFPKAWRKGRVETLQRMWGLNRALAELRHEGTAVDVIHGHYLGTGPIAVLVGRLRRLPVVITENYSANLWGGLSRYEVGLARFAYRRAAVVCPVSQLLERQLRLMVPRARYAVVPDVVDVDAFDAGPRPLREGPGRRILVVSNLVPRKGLDYLIEAVRLLVAEGRPVELTVVGEGPEHGTLAAQAAGLPVNFVGSRSRDEVVRLLSEADTFAMPTLADPFAIAAVEAVAAGVPVVVTSAAGCAELIGPLGARVVPPADPAALRDALVEALDGPVSVTAEIAETLRGYCGPEAVGKRLDSIYRTAADARAR